MNADDATNSHQSETEGLLVTITMLLKSLTMSESAASGRIRV